MIAEVIKYQVGVDVLGFPIIHQHIFINDVEEEISHTKIGKNMRKKKGEIFTNNTCNCKKCKIITIPFVFRTEKSIWV